MSHELSEERRRLIYRYVQDAGTTPAVAREPERAALPRPLPEAVMLGTETGRGPELEHLFVPPVAARPWQERLLHLRYRYARQSGGAALVAFATALGWLVAHIS